ncbi:hypothetical protein U1Q18_027512 [Sarracenia purpurea var. burkii]
MHQRLTLHLRHILPGPQIQPSLRSIHPRHHLRLQRLRRQHRPPLRPPLLRHLIAATTYFFFLYFSHRHRLRRWTVDRPRGRRNLMLRRLLPHVAFGRRSGSAAANPRHVPLHVSGGSRPTLLQYC